MSNKSEAKAAFRLQFLEWIGTIHAGDLLLYRDLEEWAAGKSIALTLEEIKAEIRALENRISLRWRCRLFCVPKQGWKLLTGEEHADTNGRQLGSKLRSTLKRSQKRDEAVDTSLLSFDAQKRFESRAIATSSLLALTRPLTRTFEPRQIEVLTNASAHIDALELFRKKSCGVTHKN